MFNKGVGLDRGVGGGGKFYEWTGKRMREGKSSKLSSKKGASVSKFTLIKLFLTGEDLFFCFHVKNSDFSLIVSTNSPKICLLFFSGGGGKS